MESGTLLGHYRILEPLGKGGMGAVYLAEDTKLERQIALKVLPPALADDAERRERFVREAKTVAALNHPNIVVIHSVEEADDQVFLTMEQVDGVALTHRIAGGAMPLGELFDIAIPLSDAISAAHQKGIAHRDLKPDNVMITADGRVKVLDFGLAKLVESEESQLEGAATEMLTEEGKILGTVAYMSPEQAQGKTVDGRSDIFSLGILLYEMATGRRPFDGDSKISVLSSLIKDTPVPVTEVNRALPRHLGRIIRHCLEKDPGRRYQSALDVRNELESLREEIRSGEVDLPSGEQPDLSGALSSAGISAPQHSADTSLPSDSGPGSLIGSEIAARPSNAGRNIGLAAVVLAVITAGWWFLGRGDDITMEPPVQAVAADATPSIAVLPFDNTSGAEDLAWLSDGLAEMFSTDLSQARGLRVVGGERIREVLDELGRDADALDSMDTVREVAQRAGTSTVVAGSFVQAGEQFRITARLIDAATGEVLDGESVDGQGQDSVFASVDALSRWVRGVVEPSNAMTASDVPIDRDLVDVTTDSVDAFRLYAEGLKRADQGQYEQAIEFFEEAVRVDPEFALAYVKLSVTHGNIFSFEARDRNAERALELADRLTERERYYFEGAYYQRSPTTLERAVAAYGRAVELYPDDLASLNNLAAQLGALGRREEAVEMFEEALRRGTTFGGTKTNLIENLLALGRIDEAAQRATEMVDEDPTNAAAQQAWFMVLMARGEYDEAKRVFDAHAMDFPITSRLGDGFSLEFHLSGAEAALDVILNDPSDAPIKAMFEPYGRRALALYEGNVSAAIATMDSIPPRAGAFYWISQMEAGELELWAGDPEAGLERALRARERIPDLGGQLQAISLAAVARALLGRTTGVDSLLAEYERIVADFQTLESKRDHRALLGQIALIRQDAETAVRELSAAAALLDHPAAGDNPNPYVRVSHALGRAYLLAGNHEAARETLIAVTEVGPLHTISDPISRVLAWYDLGQAYEGLGNAAAARSAYETFLSYWADGELARDEVAAAQAYLAG